MHRQNPVWKGRTRKLIKRVVVKARMIEFTCLVDPRILGTSISGASSHPTSDVRIYPVGAQLDCLEFVEMAADKGI